MHDVEQCEYIFRDVGIGERCHLLKNHLEEHKIIFQNIATYENATEAQIELRNLNDEKVELSK